MYFATGEIPGPLGSAHRLSAPYQALRTKDGYINIGAATQSTWEKMCGCIGRPELVTDPRFATSGDRKGHENELAGLLEATFSQETTHHWMKLLEAAAVPCGPINDLKQVYSDPQVLQRQMVVELEDPELGTLKNIGIPVKLSLTPGKIRRRAPDLGEHSREILLNAGYTGEEVSRLREAGIVKEW